MVCTDITLYIGWSADALLILIQQAIIKAAFSGKAELLIMLTDTSFQGLGFSPFSERTFPFRSVFHLKILPSLNIRLQNSFQYVPAPWE